MNSLSNYKRIRDLGEGGFGTVWQAEENATGRQVAIKQLRADKTDDEFAELFKKEVGYLYDFDHPNIVKLVYGNLRERYLVMEYMAGGNLRNEMRDYPRGQMPAKRALTLIRQVLDALEYIHARSLVHRDIKPGNLLMDEAGDVVKLSDFGAAWNTSRAGRPEWRTIGDANYESPEQIEQKRELDGRSDLYSLGFVLYEMLAGERPFGPGKARLTEALPDLRKVRPDLPKPVVALVTLALAVHPNDRFLDAGAMRTALDAALKVATDALPPETKQTRRQTTPTRRMFTGKPSRRVIVPVLLALAIVASVGLAGWQFWRAAATNAASPSSASTLPTSVPDTNLAAQPAPAVTFAPTQSATLQPATSVTTGVNTASTPSKKVAPTVTLRPMPTATATSVPPTNTPVPTDTPIPPTATSRPTRRPITTTPPEPTAIPLPPVQPTLPPPPVAPAAPASNITIGRRACPFAPDNIMQVSSSNGRFCALWDGKNASVAYLKSNGALSAYGYACLDKGDGAGLQGPLPASFEIQLTPTYGTRVIRVRVAPPGNGTSCDALTNYYDDVITLQLDWGAY